MSAGIMHADETIYDEGENTTINQSSSYRSPFSSEAYKERISQRIQSFEQRYLDKAKDQGLSDDNYSRRSDLLANMYQSYRGDINYQNRLGWINYKDSEQVTYELQSEFGRLSYPIDTELIKELESKIQALTTSKRKITRELDRYPNPSTESEAQLIFALDELDGTIKYNGNSNEAPIPRTLNAPAELTTQDSKRKRVQFDIKPLE